MLKGRFIALLVAACVAVLPLFTAWSFASEVDDKRAELNEVQSQMQKMQERKEKARQKAEAASVGLEEIQTRINQLRGQARELQGKSDALQAKIDDNKAKLAQKQAEVDKRKKIYSKRLRQIYMNGQVNYLDVLLGARDFSDFASRMYLLQKIISSDIEMLQQLQKAEAEVRERQEQLDIEMRDIEVAKAELEAKRSRANRLKEQRSYMLYKAHEEEQQSQSEYERLLAISENITAMLRMAENLKCKVVVPIHWDVWTNFQADCEEIALLYNFKKLRNEYTFHPFFWQVGGKYTYPQDKDKWYFHHRRGFEDCFEHPQNIPYRSCL